MRLLPQLAILAVLAAAGGGAWYMTMGGGAATQGPSAAAPRPVSVVAVPAAKGDILVSFDAVGTLRANEAVTVTSKTAGIVKAIQFTEGQQVQAGSVLVELDDTEARANLAVAEANRRNIQQLLDRSRALLGRQAVAQARVDELMTELQGAEASVRAAQARLQDLTIRAPFTGITGLRQVSPGALVRPADPVTTLDDVREVKLDFTVPQAALRSLGPGMTVNGLTSAFPGQPFQGKVTAIDTRVDPLSRTLTVVATLPNGEQKLKPGMFMTVQLTLENRKDVVLVPEEALVPVGDQQFAFAVVDNKAQRRPLKIGARQSGMVEVLDGIRAGELVVTRGVQKVRDGQPVAPQVPQGLAPAVAQRPTQS
ncbi:efflux RND transporter periplasmic adaptor subunit [Aerophototrophica crusticola]|uniref:Efflux RND transporter periplasmic adaptor subunit n=1 Tax=Aerophototrophica crusticola TaxID=1709002 RepID=A0A858RAW5_9PROT|nr:efflux RND transporter periplasmic adaptor subunit [Rhodospirillaceae bacterium B3]